MNKRLITLLILALAAAVIAGCSPAGLHGTNDGQNDEGAASHQAGAADFEAETTEFSERMVVVK